MTVVATPTLMMAGWNVANAASLMTVLRLITLSPSNPHLFYLNAVERRTAHTHSLEHFELEYYLKDHIDGQQGTFEHKTHGILICSEPVNLADAVFA